MTLGVSIFSIFFIAMHEDKENSGDEKSGVSSQGVVRADGLRVQKNLRGRIERKRDRPRERGVSKIAASPQ